jgi:hypothetical protein
VFNGSGSSGNYSCFVRSLSASVESRVRIFVEIERVEERRQSHYHHPSSCTDRFIRTQNSAAAMASSLISTSSRSLKADDATNGIICSPYTDVHIVNFSYTIDTPSNDEETIRNAIGEFESRSLNWLAGSLLPCNGRRGLVDALEENGDYVGPAFESESFVANNEEVLKKEGQRYLRPDMFRELGIAGLKSWPDDILSTSSE